KPWKPNHHALSSVLAIFKATRATDPRDKVYAFLGLAEELGQAGTLHPAYEKPITEVFRDAIKFMLQLSNSLNDLALKEDPQQTKTPGLESWVPDFISHGLTLPRGHPVLSLWSAEELAGNMHFMFRPSGVLEARGLQLRQRIVIAGLGSDPAPRRGQTAGLFSLFGGSRPSWDILRSSISAMYSAQMILKGQHSDDAQIELFPEEMGAILPELDAAWAEGRRSDEGIAMAQVALKELSRPISAEAFEFLKQAENNCSGKHLFTTREGQMGVGPISTREGDEIWNLVGADAPFVLRPQGDGRYTLLGGAYVHGAMFAEWHEGDFDAVAKDIKTVLLV
ncbi:hypothetical protein BHE90_008619, partial [Fusarium euwallaceae]